MTLPRVEVITLGGEAPPLVARGRRSGWSPHLLSWV